jgi:hypothetical protein
MLAQMWLALLLASSNLQIGVDRRVELISILFRLAENPSYQKARGPYADDVDRSFAPFRDHPAVAATRELRARFSISYDAPIKLAVYLDASFKPLRPLSPTPPGLDKRWEGAPIDDYLAKVRDFSAKARFDDFYRAHAGYYQSVEAAFRASLAKTPIIPWFDAAFRARKGARYSVIPGLLTGPMNYGTSATHRDGGEDIVQVMYLENPDAQAVPHPTERTLELLAHEFAHSYIHPLLELESFRESGQPVFARVEPAMRAQAYTTYPIMVEESVVRAVTILYLRDRSSAEHAARSLAEQQRLSFLWMSELVTALDDVRKKQHGHFAAAPLGQAVKSVLASWLAAHPK